MTTAFRKGYVIVASALCALLAGCSGERALSPRFHAEDNPETLSEWGVLRARNGVLELAGDATPYDLATPLFSDYALKLRTVWTPGGAPAVYGDAAAFDFPVGTIVTKTFYYETGENRDIVRADGARTLRDGVMSLAGVRLIETRVLARRAEGWAALAYVWNDAQTEARLKRAGDVVPLTLVRADGRREAFAYLVPNENQCAGCHATDAATRAIKPIGLKARHLNKPSAFHPGFNQLDVWRLKGLLTGDFSSAAAAPRSADWTDADEPLAARARLSRRQLQPLPQPCRPRRDFRARPGARGGGPRSGAVQGADRGRFGFRGAALRNRSRRAGRVHPSLPYGNE